MNIIEQVKKCLALANDPAATEGERANAMSIASFLMQKHAIDQSSLVDKPGVLLKQITAEDAEDQWHGWLASAVGLINTVRPVDYSGGTYAFIGRPDQVEGACVMFPWLVSQVEQLYKRGLPKGMSKTDRANYRRTFKQACAARVWHRANKLVQALRKDDTFAMKNTGSRALVVVASIDQQLNDIKKWMEDSGREVKQKTSKATKAGLGSSAGARAGNEVQINKQVQGSRLMLEDKR